MQQLQLPPDCLASGSPRPTASLHHYPLVRSYTLPLCPACLLTLSSLAASVEMRLPCSTFLPIALLSVRTGKKTFQLLLHFHSTHFLRPLQEQNAVSHLLLIIALSDNSKKNSSCEAVTNTQRYLNGSDRDGACCLHPPTGKAGTAARHRSPSTEQPIITLTCHEQFLAFLIFNVCVRLVFISHSNLLKLQGEGASWSLGACFLSAGLTHKICFLNDAFPLTSFRQDGVKTQ